MSVEKKARFSIWYVLLGVWVVLLIQNMLVSALSVERIPYSQFLKLLQEGKIKEIAVSQNTIEGRIQADGATPEKTFRTIRVDPELSKELEKYGVTFKGEVENTFFRDLLSWILPVLLFVGIWYFMIRRIGAQQPGFMTLGKNKAKIYVEEDLNVRFSDVAGVDEAKEELEEIIEFLRYPQKYTELGGKMPKGVLLVGPPGSGKTLLAQAVAGESHVPFFSMSGSEFVEMFVGLGAARVRDLFTQAKSKAPCIIFVDELDALGKARGISGIGGHDEREQTLNQLLVEMDGFDPTVGVILMAATNRPEILDPALLRPGRFDRHVLVDRPDKKGREAILKVHMRNVKLGEDIDPEKIANMTPGLVGADLANLVNEAALLAVRHGKNHVGMAEFEEAVERIIAGLEKKSRVINKKERNIVAHHEVGHALVALSLPGTEPVQKISIIPRGIAALGYTLQVPTEDRFLMTKSELLNKVAVLLGGRAAETVVFGDVSTGAHNDLAKATDIARSMMKQYGMSRQLGHVYYDKERHGQFLETGFFAAPNEYSEGTARMIDDEIREVIEEQFKKALDIVEKKRESLDKAAEVLLQKEVITGDQLKTIMVEFGQEPVQIPDVSTGETKGATDE
ncbi:MAG: ATP-dependent metallopeptidase FtsH/Yme1/Tma family protein [Deltaproteobacteria bacterium]|nr:ATP-dependent metallopeptidase FtsH/Yme1/Tma family protein [Deltaproteobacteria bacterium]